MKYLLRTWSCVIKKKTLKEIWSVSLTVNFRVNEYSLYANKLSWCGKHPIFQTVLYLHQTQNAGLSKQTLT